MPPSTHSPRQRVCFNSGWRFFRGDAPDAGALLVGFNYKPRAYANFQRRYPSVPVLGAETASTVSSRGEYFFPVSDDPAEGRADFQISSYDPRQYGRVYLGTSGRGTLYGVPSEAP